jgi:hypothetical protein
VFIGKPLLASKNNPVSREQKDWSTRESMLNSASEDGNRRSIRSARTGVGMGFAVHAGELRAESAFKFRRESVGKS